MPIFLVQIFKVMTEKLNEAHDKLVKLLTFVIEDKEKLKEGYNYKLSRKKRERWQEEQFFKIESTKLSFPNDKCYYLLAQENGYTESIKFLEVNEIDELEVNFSEAPSLFLSYLQEEEILTTTHTIKRKRFLQSDQEIKFDVTKKTYTPRYSLTQGNVKTIISMEEALNFLFKFKENKASVDYQIDLEKLDERLKKYENN